MDNPLHAGGNAESWLEDHGDLLIAYALRRVGSLDIAEDLVQETLLAAFKGREQFAGQSSVQTWLVSILRRKIIDHYRAQARQTSHGDEAHTGLATPFNEEGFWRVQPRGWSETPSHRLESAEFLEILAKCVDKLGPTLGAAFRLRVIQELETEEICSLLAISPTNLSVRLNRARHAMRRCLDENWFHEDLRQ